MKRLRYLQPLLQVTPPHLVDSKESCSLRVKCHEKSRISKLLIRHILQTSVADPDPNPDPDPLDPHVFGPSGSESGSFYHHAKIVGKTLIPTIL
jgi:hypothetical protein